MTFSLSGNTIIQTGTDADLSGLAGVSGVTVTTRGAGTSLHRSYNFGNHSFRQQGQLTIDPRVETLVGGSGHGQFQQQGTLNLGVEYSLNGADFTTPGPALVLPNASLGSCCSGQALDVTGTLNHYGATLVVGACIRWQAACTLNFKDAVIQSCRGASLWRIRSFATQGVIDGLRVVGTVSIDWFATFPNFSGYVAEQSTDRVAEFVGNQSGGTNDTYVFSDYSSVGSASDFSIWQEADVLLQNLAKPDALNCAFNESGVASSSASGSPPDRMSSSMCSSCRSTASASPWSATWCS